jgi:flagellar biosynthetic protein FliR
LLEFVRFLQEGQVIAFMLLFFRFGALFMAVPIFSHTTIPMTQKAMITFFFTIVFFDAVPPLQIDITIPSVILAILSEMLFGLAIGVMLQIAYNVITYAGGIVSFMMGFSMASAIDPQNGVSMPIISQFLSLIALMVLFSLNFHHWIIMYIYHSLSYIPLGGFIITKNMISYAMQATSHMFMVGFMIAFPITALTLLADVIFGMIMKTMPQFNLLVIGFPIKIFISFVVLIAVLASMIVVFKNEILDSFNILEIFF